MKAIEANSIILGQVDRGRQFPACVASDASWRSHPQKRPSLCVACQRSSSSFLGHQRQQDCCGEEMPPRAPPHAAAYVQTKALCRLEDRMIAAKLQGLDRSRSFKPCSTTELLTDAPRGVMMRPSFTRVASDDLRSRNPRYALMASRKSNESRALGGHPWRRRRERHCCLL